MAVQVILFDVGGVLSEGMVERKLDDLASRYGLERMHLRRIGEELREQADLGAMSDPDYWAEVLRRAGVQARPQDAEIEPFLTLTPGTLELARELKGRVRVGILSNDSREMARARRAKFGFDLIFEPILISSDVGLVKPDVRIYKWAAQRLRVEPGAIVFVDDREENVEGARRAGLQAVHFLDARQLREALREYGF